MRAPRASSKGRVRASERDDLSADRQREILVHPFCGIDADIHHVIDGRQAQAFRPFEQREILEMRVAVGDQRKDHQPLEQSTRDRSAAGPNGRE